jgi:riboflavin biosynthesis pyrimidine reductase
VESSELDDLQLSSLYSWPSERSFGLNLVLTDTGASTGTDGTSLSLTSAEDRRILKLLRAKADVVIVGAQSVRSEGWFLPPHGRLAILSTSGNIPWESCPDASRVGVYPSVSALIHSLRNEEKRILCEGGLTAASLIAERVGFDQIALTRIGTQGIETVPSELTPFESYTVSHTLTDSQNNMTFQYWRRAVERQ